MTQTLSSSILQNTIYEIVYCISNKLILIIYASTRVNTAAVIH